VAKQFPHPTAEKTASVQTLTGKRKYNLRKCSAFEWKAEQFLKRTKFRGQE
jgi:hypothetical protein